MKKRKFILYLAFVLFASDVTAYAFFAHQFEIKSAFRTVWGLSLYIVSFLAVIRVEEIHRNIIKHAKKLNPWFFSISLFFSIVSQFFLSFNLAYYHDGSRLHILLSIIFISLCCYILVVPNILLKYYTYISKAEKNEKAKEIERQGMKYSETIFEYLVNKNISLKDKTHIIWGNNLVVVFYIVYIFTLCFINIFSKNVHIENVYIVAISYVILLMLNWTKCCLCNYRKKTMIIECGLLTLSIVTYIVFQWFIIPVSFNILLSIVVISMLGYTINNNILLAHKMVDMFSDIDK